MKTRDGGPAFPLTFDEVPAKSLHQAEVNKRKLGMSLRDYFAAAALPALLDTEMIGEPVATMAYQMADAMLEARKIKHLQKDTTK